MTRWKTLAAALLAVPLLGVGGVYAYMHGLGDLRTEHARVHGASAEAQARGRELLAESLEALGGVARWHEVREEPVEIVFRHDWYHALLRRFFMPIEFSGQELALRLRPGHLDTRLTFRDGDGAGRAWELVDGDTSTVDDDVAFHLLGYRFFFFMPFLLSEAELITDAGTGELHGETYDLVYVTWGQWEPQREYDQYLVWIDRETRLVDYVQSTVREKFARSIVSLALSDHRDALGLRMPFSLRVLEDIDDVGEGMHHIEVLSIDATP